MQNDSTGARVLRADAILSGLVGLILMSGTWDALYNALDLPHLGPPLLAQLGGAGLLALAYLLWIAPENPALVRPVARAVAIANGLGALIIAAWLILKGQAPLDIGTQGFVELAVAAVVLAVLAVLQLRIASRG